MTDASSGSDPTAGRAATRRLVDRYAIDPNCSQEELIAVAKVYAREVVAAHDLSVSVSGLDWSVSTRAKRRAGAVTYRDGVPQEVILTWGQFQNDGWEATAETVRHELVHVHLLNEDADPSHGAAFRRLADRLDTHVHCERFTEPAYWVRCMACAAEIPRYRRSKLVREPGSYACGNCGGDLRVDETDDGSDGR